MLAAELLEATPLDTDSATLGITDRRIEGVDQELLTIPAIPRLPKARSIQVKVGAGLLENAAQIHMQFVHRRTAPVPVAVVDAEDPKARLQDEGVRDHWIVRIGVLLNVEILLHCSLRVTKERPLGTKRVPELVQVERIVR